MLRQANWLNDHSMGEMFTVGEPTNRYFDQNDQPCVVKSILIDESGYLLTFNDGTQIAVRNTGFDADLMDLKSEDGAKGTELDGII